MDFTFIMTKLTATTQLSKNEISQQLSKNEISPIKEPFTHVDLRHHQNEWQFKNISYSFSNDLFILLSFRTAKQE